MIYLPIAAIAALIYHTYHAIKAASYRRKAHALRVSSWRASDLEQWRSIDC